MSEWFESARVGFGDVLQLCRLVDKMLQKLTYLNFPSEPNTKREKRGAELTDRQHRISGPESFSSTSNTTSGARKSNNGSETALAL